MRGVFISHFVLPLVKPVICTCGDKTNSIIKLHLNASQCCVFVFNADLIIPPRPQTTPRASLSEPHTKMDIVDQRATAFGDARTEYNQYTRAGRVRDDLNLFSKRSRAFCMQINAPNVREREIGVRFAAVTDWRRRRPARRSLCVRAINRPAWMCVLHMICVAYTNAFMYLVAPCTICVMHSMYDGCCEA